MKLPEPSKTTEPEAPQTTASKSNSTHWTTIGGFWIGVASILVAVVFGSMSLFNHNCADNVRKGHGKKEKKGGMVERSGGGVDLTSVNQGAGK